MREERNPGRPRAFDEEEVLETIMELFWKKGYEGTSLSDIVSATGLKKGSLYTSFGDKHTMYIKALNHYHRNAVIGICTVLRSPAPPFERLKNFLSAPIDATEATGDDGRGCFLCNAAADRASVDPEIAQIVRTGFEIMQQATADVLQEARHSGDSHAAAGSIVAVYSGLRLMARAGIDITALKNTRDAALSAFA